MEITNFTENDFISTLVFGAGGIILFYFLPIAIFSYFIFSLEVQILI
jgi:hypothetical protein